MNSNLGKSSFDFEFDLGMGTNRSRSLNDQKNQSNSTFTYSQPKSTPAASPWQQNKPSWTHQPSPVTASAVGRGEIGGGSGSMVGDITGKSWNSMGIGSSGGSIGSIGIVKKDPNLFGDLVSSALGQGNRNSSNAPLKSVVVNAASGAGKGSFGMGGLGEALPKSGNNGMSNGNAGLKQASSEQFGSFVSAPTSGGGGIGLNKGLNLGGIGGSVRSVGGGSVSSSKDPFGSLVDFGSKPLGSGHVSSGSKAGSAANVNSGSKNGWAGSGDFDFGDFQNAPKSTIPGVSSNVFSSGNDKHTSSSSASAFPMESFSSKSQVPVQSSEADSFDMLFPSSSVSSEAPKARSGASVSQPFSDIGEDWGLESEFGGGDQDLGGTTELDGLPPPPAGVSASTAKNKGIDNQKQGQYADAIKWLSWAVILLEKAGDVNGTMEVLITRASCYKEVGEYKKAVSDCTKVLDQDGKNVSVLVQRALLYESIEKYKLGAEDLRTVMKIDPGNRVARSTIHRLIKLAG